MIDSVAEEIHEESNLQSQVEQYITKDYKIVQKSDDSLSPREKVASVTNNIIQQNIAPSAKSFTTEQSEIKIEAFVNGKGNPKFYEAKESLNTDSRRAKQRASINKPTQ